MRYKFLRHFGNIAVLTVAAALLSACATTGNLPTQKLTGESMKNRALERSTERWKALTDKRFSDAFAFLSEASRLGISETEYDAAMKRMGYISAKPESATCDDSICTVNTTVTLPIFVRGVGALPQNVPVAEQWILNNGELWLIRR